MVKEKISKEDLKKKITDLKIELLKQTQKRKSIKREIARALTMINQTKSEEIK